MWYTDIATKRPLGAQTEARLTRKNKIIIHTMVGSLWGTDSYFRSGGYSGTESHFGTGYDGEILQWQDDEYEADAQLQGNDDCISIENADRGTGFPDWNTSGDNVPPFTAAQIEANAKIIARVATRHGIPIVLITNTQDSTRGIGYHRQGIDPYRTHGEQYSTAYGKVCPGDERIAQIQQIITRARQIVNGVEPEPPKEWDELATKAEVKSAAYDAVLEAIGSAEGRAALNTARKVGLNNDQELVTLERGLVADAITIALRHNSEFKVEFAKGVGEGLASEWGQALLMNGLGKGLRDGEVARREFQELVDLSVDKMLASPAFAAAVKAAVESV